MSAFLHPQRGKLASIALKFMFGVKNCVKKYQALLADGARVDSLNS